MTESNSTTEATLRLLRNVIGPATALTGALYYFGWVRTRAIAAYFGLDPEMLGLGTADYVLRSVVAVPPVAVAMVGLPLVGRLIRARWERDLPITTIRRHGGWLLRLGWVGFAIGSVLLAAFDVLTFRGPWVAAIAPAVVLLSVWAVLTGQRFSTATGARPGLGPSTSAPLAAHLGGALGVGAVLAFFAGVFLVADWLGGVSASRLANGLDDATAVTLTSERDLFLYGSRSPDLIDETGIDRAPDGSLLTQPAEERYRYQYRDLRLLIEANDRWFLVPADWRDNRIVHVVAIDGSVRLDFDDRSS